MRTDKLIGTRHPPASACFRAMAGKRTNANPKWEDRYERPPRSAPIPSRKQRRVERSRAIDSIAKPLRVGCLLSAVACAPRLAHLCGQLHTTSPQYTVGLRKVLDAQLQVPHFR